MSARLTFWVESKGADFSCAVAFPTRDAAIAEADRRLRSGAFCSTVYAVEAGKYSGVAVWPEGGAR